jgi:tetratricopeptide (TPR) repeat protein
VLEGRQNHKPAAETAFATAEKLYRASSNDEGIAEIEYQRGDIAAANLDLKSARTLLMEALAFAQDHSPQLQARVLCRLSAVEHVARKDKYAESWGERALSTAQAEGLAYWAAEAECRLATAYVYPWTGSKGAPYSRVADADRYAQLALQTAERNRWPLVAADSQLTLALIRNQQARPADGLRFAEAALGYHRQAGYFTESTRALILNIRAKNDLAEFYGALSLCRQGLDLENKSGSPPVMIQMEETVGTVFFALERYPDALGHFETAETLALQNATQFAGYETVHVAASLWELGRYSEAETRLRDVAAGEPKESFWRAVCTLF